MYKPLEPSDDPDYVLIQKKSLLVNGLAFARMSMLLSRLLRITDSDLTTENLAQEVGDFARNQVDSLSQEEINADIQAILARVETGNGLVIVTNESD
jgi:hypothetical protein